MNNETLAALCGSIRKWMRIASNTDVDNGWKNCPLCDLFFNSEVYKREDNCYNCPVKDTTNKTDCGATPYIRWWDHQIYVHSKEKIPRIHCPECERLALEEMRFLCGLLPYGEAT